MVMLKNHCKTHGFLSMGLRKPRKTHGFLSVVLRKPRKNLRKTNYNNIYILI